MPAIREGEDYIEIDQRKKHWPFLRVTKVGDKVAIYMDCNEAGQIIGEGVGLAGMTLSAKKARALRDFLDRVIDE